MRNAFAKRFAAVMLVLCMLAALPVATAYAADAETGYVVTFRAGEHGHFSDTYIESLRSEYDPEGADYDANEYYNVYVNDETAPTVVSVLVTGDKNLPTAPQLPSEEGDSDIIINDGSEDYVLIDAGVNDDYYAYTTESRTRDYDFVAEYALRGDRQDVSYVVRYLLEGTEQEVAPSVRGTAPEGLTLTLTAVSVDEYTPVSGTKQVTMTKNEDGSPVEVIFYYIQNVHVTSTTQYEDGGTVVEYNDVNVVAGTATAGGGAAGTAGGAGGAAAGDGAGAAGDGDAAVGGEGEGAGEAQLPGGGEEVIGDNETPQAGGEEAIGDNETPLAESESGVSVPVVVGGIAVLLVVILLVTFLVRKRRNGADE